jgi:hypothetical protein
MGGRVKNYFVGSDFYPYRGSRNTLKDDSVEAGSREMWSDASSRVRFAIKMSQRGLAKDAIPAGSRNFAVRGTPGGKNKSIFLS